MITAVLLLAASLSGASPEGTVAGAPAGEAAKAAKPAGKKPAITASALLKRAPGVNAGPCRTTPADGQLVRAALFSGESRGCPVAKIGDEVITLGELAGVLEEAHLRRDPAANRAGKGAGMEFGPALDRLVSVRLLSLEAREMGLDEDPSIKKAVDDFAASRLRDLLLQRNVWSGLKPDPAEVKELTRRLVRQWKVKSLLFEKEESAKKLQEELKAGKSFDALAKRYLAEKKAAGGEKAEWLSPKHMLPEILAAVEKAKVGAVAPTVKIAKGWVVLRVDGTRYPESKKARLEAEQASLARLRQVNTRSYYEALAKKNAVVDEALLKALDFEAKEPGFEALLKDSRVVVRIDGDRPITVGDLTAEVSKAFFHGIESPIKEKRVNAQKAQAFEKLLGTRLFAHEAAVQKLDRVPEYRAQVEEYRRGAVFDIFIEKVIVPGMKISEGDGLAYFEQHKKEFTSPQMYKLDGLAFLRVSDAQAALQKLKSGTDLAWMHQNADGQVKPDARALSFDGGTVSATTLPAPLVKALTGSRAGDYRLYSASDTEHYVVLVKGQTPPATERYENVRQDISKILFAQRLRKAIDEYAGKIRKVQKVEVFLTKIAS